ncbi:MAG: hypothetical protein HKM04_07405, partial [Legionellales bacterium]|nr:hypothetical protein [Legionellales bacterium]
QPVLHRLITGMIDNPQINTLLPLCEYFNCTLDRLIFGDLTDETQELIPIKHIMRNCVCIINSFLQGIGHALPIFTESYSALPKEFRGGELPAEMLHMIPNMLNHSIKALTDLREAINRL